MEATVNGVRLHYRVRGGGDPVLFLHGFPLSGALWDPVLERLGGGFRAIVPDLRGMGASEAGAAAGMADYADDAVGLLDALAESRPAVVVGMSMGGYVALELCRRHPERVRALALVDTRAGPDTEEAARGRHETAARVLREGSGAVADAILGKLFAPGAPADLREHWRAVMAATPPQGAAAASRAMADRPDSTDTLRSLGRPVLVVVGEEDVVTPPEEARRMAEAAGGAPVETIPGAGHMAAVEQPEAVAAALRRFLLSLPPPAG